jgi:hypothetical protein
MKHNGFNVVVYISFFIGMMLCVCHGAGVIIYMVMSLATDSESMFSSYPINRD